MEKNDKKLTESEFYANLRLEEDKRLSKLSEEERILEIQKSEDEAIKLAKKLGLKVITIGGKNEEE